MTNGNKKNQKKLWLIAAVAAVGTLIILVAVWLQNAELITNLEYGVYYPPPRIAGSYTSTEGLKNTAAKYAQNAEKPGLPVTLKYNNTYYNYVPFEINGTISSTFPGIILDRAGKPVTSFTTLRELYRYPGLLKRFSDDVTDFNSLSAGKASAVRQYCLILTRQEQKMYNLWQTGTAWGILYEGTKVAYDGVGMAHSFFTGGLSGLIKDLAKDQVKKLILSYFSKADMNLVMANVQSAYEYSTKASKSCQTALNSWQALSNSQSGKITPDNAFAATAELTKMFHAESIAISRLRSSLARINDYPKILTAINKSNYNSAMNNLSQLVTKLSEEKDYWRQESDNTTTFLDFWANEQLSRVR